MSGPVGAGTVVAMLDGATRTLIETGRARRQIELSARLVGESVAPASARLDDRAEAVRERAWADLRNMIVAAVEAHAGDGLRVLRREKTRAGVILTGPVSGWRRFLADQTKLLADHRIEFRHYERPWSYGLPGLPE